jgi:hypothetical protein
MLRIALPFATAVVLAPLAAGCGGGANSPGVANLASSPPAAAGGTTTTTQADPGPPVKSFVPAGRGSQFQIGMAVGTADGEKFSQCMRKHGIPNFPDPDHNGVVTIKSGMGIDPGSPAFTSARSVCMKLLPNGGQPTPAQIAQRQQQLLQLSACMRAHGIKDFPDPSNGGLQVQVHRGSDLDPNNPTFQRARQACKKYLPFKGGAVKTGAG